MNTKYNSENGKHRANWLKWMAILTAFILLCTAFMPDFVKINPFASASAIAETGCDEVTEPTEEATEPTEEATEPTEEATEDGPASIMASRYRTKEAVVYTGQFPMITSDNGHVCGYYNDDPVYRIGVQNPVTCVPNFYPNKRFAKVYFYEGYHDNLFMTYGFSDYYGSFKVLPGCEEDFWNTIQNRYGAKFGVDVRELPDEEIPKAISFSSMRFDTYHLSEYGAHQYFKKNEEKRLVAYLVFGEDDRFSIPVYIGKAKGDTLYSEILGFEAGMFNGEGIDFSKCAIYGIHLFGYGDFMLRETNYKLEGMVAPNEQVESLGYQQLPEEVKGPSTLTEHGPIRNKSKSEVNLEDMRGFTNLYFEADIDPEWCEYFCDYILYIIEAFNIPEGPDQLAEALALGATHFEFYSETVFENGEKVENTGVKSSNIFFTSKTERYLIGKVWFLTGYVDLYFGDFYRDGKLVLGFSAGYQYKPTPEPTATPAPTKRPPKKPTNNTPSPTCPPCTCPPTCPPTTKQSCPCIIPFGIGVGIGYTLSTLVRSLSTK